MLRNLRLMQVDLSCPVELKNKKTGCVIGKVGFLNVEDETVDVTYKDVSHIPDEVVLELPSSEFIDDLEAYFNEMFNEMMLQDV